MRADASDKAIGAVLEQYREVTPGHTSLVPVAFLSRKLGKSQLNWTPGEGNECGGQRPPKMGWVDRPAAHSNFDRP